VEDMWRYIWRKCGKGWWIVKTMEEDSECLWEKANVSMKICFSGKWQTIRKNNNNEWYKQEKEWRYSNMNEEESNENIVIEKRKAEKKLMKSNEIIRELITWEKIIYIINEEK